MRNIKFLVCGLALGLALFTAKGQTYVTNYSTNTTITATGTAFGTVYKTNTSVTPISVTTMPVTVPLVVPMPVSVGAVSASVPTNLPPTTFFQSFQDYFTTFGTNNWNGTKGFLSTGPLYQHSVNFGNIAELSVDVKDFDTNVSLYADVLAINPIGLGDPVATEVGVEFGYRIHDVQVLAGLRGGYNFQQKKGEGSFKIGVQKLLTQNTFAEADFVPTFYGRSVKDYIEAQMGFKF